MSCFSKYKFKIIKQYTPEIYEFLKAIDVFKNIYFA